MAELTRRQVARTAAWSVPVLAVGVAAPAASASTPDASCPGIFAGPVTSWLSSTGFSSDLGGPADPVWYLQVSLDFLSAGCGFGSSNSVTTDVGGVVVHTAQRGTAGTLTPLSHTSLNSFSDNGYCSDTLIMAFNSLGATDLYARTVSFTYIVSGLPGQGATPCTVPVTATLTYPTGATGNDAKGSVVIG